MRRIAACLFTTLAVVGMTCTLIASSPSPARNAPIAPAPEPAELRGLVNPARIVEIHALMDGTISRVAVKEGQTVNAGDLLLQMDDGVQQAAVATAQLEADAVAEIEYAKATVNEAKVQLDRMLDAEKKGAASDWEVRKAKYQVDQAAAQIKSATEKKQQAGAKLKLEQERLARYKVNAPWKGYIRQVQQHEGATVTIRDTVITLVQMDELEATVYIPAEIMTRFKPGDEVTIRPEKPVTPDKQFKDGIKAKIKNIDQVIDTASGSTRCVLSIANNDLKLPAGFMVFLKVPPAP